MLKKVKKNTSYLPQDIGFEDNNYISFNEKTGRTKSYNAVLTYLRRLSENTKIRKITFHDLRHMFATILLEQGTPIAQISLVLGHGSINTTYEHYLNMMNEKNEITAFFNNEYPYEGE